MHLRTARNTKKQIVADPRILHSLTETATHHDLKQGEHQKGLEFLELKVYIKTSNLDSTEQHIVFQYGSNTDNIFNTECSKSTAMSS